LAVGECGYFIYPLGIFQILSGISRCCMVIHDQPMVISMSHLPIWKTQKSLENTETNGKHYDSQNHSISVWKTQKPLENTDL